MCSSDLPELNKKQAASDKKAEHRQRSMEKKDVAHYEKTTHKREIDEQEKADDEERAAQKEESNRRKSLESITKDDKPVSEQKPVVKADVTDAQILVQGQVPGAALAQVHNSQDFLNSDLAAKFPKVAALLRNGNLEGCYISDGSI